MHDVTKTAWRPLSERFQQLCNVIDDHRRPGHERADSPLLEGHKSWFQGAAEVLTGTALQKIADCASMMAHYEANGYQREADTRREKIARWLAEQKPEQVASGRPAPT